MKTSRQILLVVTGTLIASYGIDLAIHAGFGGATLAVLWEGVSKVFHITMGQASLLIAGLMVLFCVFYDRKQVSWGTLIYQILYSLGVDLFEPYLFYTDSGAVNFFLMIAGIFLLSIGSGIYSYADFGRGSYEALTFALSDKNGWKLSYVRIALDVICVALGALLGGTFGICTIATILLSGIVLQKTVEFLHRINL